MSKLVINTGSNPNDGTGDSLRDGADKINANFTEIYGALGPNTSLSVGFGRTVIGISATTFNVGVGSTNPKSKFEVLGDLSAQSYKLGTTEVISSSGQLKNISSLDATTTATIESAVQAAPNTFTDLQITGVSTFLNGPVLIGSGTSTGTASQSFQVAGINSGAYFGGSIGIGTTRPTRRVHIYGDSSTNQLNAGVSVNSLNSSGFGAYYGINATSIPNGRDYRIVSAGTSESAGTGNFSIFDASSNVDRLIISSLGNIGIATTNPSQQLQVGFGVSVVVIDSAGELGIGISIPTSKLHVIGNSVLIGITTISTAIVTNLSAGNLTLSGISTGINATGIITAGGYVASQGTSTVAPIQLASTGALLTGNGTLGAIEYDGQNYYATGVTTTGRGFIPTVNSFRLTANKNTQSPGTGSTNYFDPGLIPLTGNGVYEIDFDLYFTKGTTGITTFTLSTPIAPTNISAVLTATPATGVSTNTPAAPQLVSVVGGATTSTSLALTLNAVTHYTKLSVLVENGTNNTNTLTLNTTNTGTITPLRGSRWKATLLTRTAGVGVTQ